MDFGEFIARLVAAPPPEECVRFVIVLFAISAMIGFTEFARKRFQWRAESLRKPIHIGVGIPIFFAPQMFQFPLFPMILAAIFILVDGFSVKFGFLRGMHGTKRYSYGTMFYPLSFLTLVVIFWHSAPEIVSLSMTALAFADPAAAYVGESMRRPRQYHLTFDKKSIEGSMAMLVVTFVTILGGAALLHLETRHTWNTIVLAAGICSVIATGWEAISSRGFDNFTVPLSIAWVLTFFFFPGPGRDAERMFVGLGLSLAMAVASWRMRFLTVNGSVAAFLMATIIFGVGGWKWTVPMLLFFVVSSLLSFAGRDRKKALEDTIEKTGPRDSWQVAANGGVAGMIAMIQFVFPQLDLYAIYLGSVAAVTADTWATEVGTIFRGRTVAFPSLRPVEPGTSGGISVAGTLGGLVGAAVIGAGALPWAHGAGVLVTCLLAGGIGSIVDSAVGTTMQAVFRCSVCGKRVEGPVHCQAPATHTSGVRWMRNDAVNWFCAAAGAAAVAML